MKTINHGSIIEIMVRRKGFTALDFGKKMKLNRHFVYLLFSKPKIRKEIVHKIGLIIGYDFPEMLLSNVASNSQGKPPYPTSPQKAKTPSFIIT